ncbi:MAG: glycosyltransferase, partial [Myxococcaceae bacterium]
VYALQLRQMTKAVEGAALCVAFSHSNGERAQELCPMVRGKLRCIPQAVDVGGAQAFNLRGALGLDGAARVVLLPTGLRRVKDPTFVVEAMAAWHEEDPSVHLVVCGAELEPGFAEQARAALTGRRGIHFVGPLSRSVLLSAMRQADVVLNTSVSEGMCGALMEAMAVGTPVLARRNAGNRSLITHGINGFLFDTPAEFRQLAQRLLDSPGSAQLLRQHARGRIEREHSVEREKFQYLGVAASLGEDRFFSAVAR